MISLSSQLCCMFPYFHFHSDVVVTTFKKNTLLLIPSCSFSSRFTICHKTEVVKNTLNPVWQPFTIPVRALCNGDYDRYCIESPCSSHLLITTAAVYPFTVAFSCFYHASPASSPALKTLTPAILTHGGQHGGSSQNSPNTNCPTRWKAAVSVFFYAKCMMNNLLSFIFCSCCDDGAFLNDNDQRGTSLHEVRIYKFFLAVDSQQQIKIVALHFDISQVLEALLLLFLSRLWQHSIFQFNRFINSAELSETENKYMSLFMARHFVSMFLCGSWGPVAQWTNYGAEDSRLSSWLAFQLYFMYK